MKKHLLIGVLVLVMACNRGLQPVTGFEGTVTFPDNGAGEVAWPDSLLGATVIFADISEIEGNIFNLNFTKLVQHISGYTDPLDTNRVTQSYFLEAYPGNLYVAGVVATTVPVISLMGMSMDSLAAHPEYFRVIGVYNPSGGALPFDFITVEEDEVTPGINITCAFDFTLPF